MTGRYQALRRRGQRITCIWNDAHSGESRAAVTAALEGEPLDLLFIDGDHSLAGAQEDFTLWLPRLAPGAALLCHDVSTASYSGPRRMFQRLVCRSPQFDAVRRVGSMMVARRTTARSWTSAAWSMTAWALLYVYDGKAWLRRIRRRSQV